VTFEELKQVLFVRSNFGMKLGLDRMREALALLDAPHLAAPVLHVAGTNGKGSTCAFTEAALRAAGLKTGLYTSPHLVHFCERIRIGGEPISEHRATELLDEILRRVPWALRDDGLTFFELATLMGFVAFAQERVQVAVVEVGLGGRLDATNVVEPLACAVTPIGLDHVQWLGPTLRNVAAEKAGIFKKNVPAVSAGQSHAAAEVLARRAAELGIPLWRPGRDYVYESRDVRPFCYEGPEGFRVSLPQTREVTGTTRSGTSWTTNEIEQVTGPIEAPLAFGSGLALAGHYQRSNAALACALLQVATGRGVPVTADHLRMGLRSARWPGRLEIVAERPLVIVDGAHNVHAAHALARALPGVVGRRPVQLVFAAMGDKDHAGMLRELLPLARAVHLCAVDSPRAAPPEELAAIARKLGADVRAVHRSVADALSAARAAALAGKQPGAVVCCGSLYLVAEVEAAGGGRPAVRMPSERL
jgi:dihydrofolate synthase / folylpolyglutamate synthase